MSTGDPCVHCWIYRSVRNDEMYLYVTREDDFEAVPPALLKALGRTERVMDLDLHPQRPLARVDVLQVIAQLKTKGYFLQMPPRITPELYAGD